MYLVLLLALRITLLLTLSITLSCKDGEYTFNDFNFDLIYLFIRIQLDIKTFILKIIHSSEYLAL